MCRRWTRVGHRAMVVVDPNDRRQLKGFLYLSSVYSPSIDRAESETSRRLYQTRQLAEKQMLQGLADKMIASTQVRVEVLDAVRHSTIRSFCRYPSSS